MACALTASVSCSTSRRAARWNWPSRQTRSALMADTPRRAYRRTAEMILRHKVRELIRGVREQLPRVISGRPRRPKRCAMGVANSHRPTRGA